MRRAYAVRTAILILGLLFAFALWLWWSSEPITVASRALDEDRQIRVFNPAGEGVTIYALDGQSLRHSLGPAMLFTFGAFLQGKPLPRIVAIHSDADRDRDFRSAHGSPTDWRPRIAGHADKFDRFLLQEVVPLIENEGQRGSGRYLMGHSLAGLYALDMAIRNENSFDGIYAFAPTFSHDTSIAERLPRLCRADVSTYVNWGLESERDTQVFERTVGLWTSSPQCADGQPAIRRHYGAIHQVVMLSGQVEAAWRFPD